MKMRPVLFDEAGHLTAGHWRASFFTDSEIVELTLRVGFITMLNRFNNALQIRYRGNLEGRQNSLMSGKRAGFTPAAQPRPWSESGQTKVSAAASDTASLMIL